MNTSRIIEILKKHNHVIGMVKLEKSGDCRDFWKDFVYNLYSNLPSSLDNGDNRMLYSYELEYTLAEFADVDSLEIVNKKGKLLKRFSNYWKSERGYKLSDSILGIIGDKLQSFINQDIILHYDFTDVIDWEDGQFGKYGSCWWGTYGASQSVFLDNGGWGIRFYDPDDTSPDEKSSHYNYTRGIGRTWLLPRNGMLLGFNSYGVSRPQTSKTLRAIFAEEGIKLHYKVVEIKNSCNDEIPYINGDSGFVLYPDELDPDRVPDSFDLHMEYDSDNDDYSLCYSCNSRIYEGDSSEYIHDRLYCWDCVQDKFYFCTHCDEYCDRDDEIETTDGESMCEDCASSKGYVKCYECDKYTDDYTTDSDGDDFCEDCADENLNYCEHCEVYIYGKGSNHNPHECPDSLDFSGLEKTVEESFYAQVTIPDMGRVENHHHVTVYHLPDITGLVLYNYKELSGNLSNAWSISHELSGLAVNSDIPTFARAKSLFFALASLTDWNRSSDELVKDADLMAQITKVIFGE